MRVLDQNGQGSVSTVLAGIQWVVQNQAKDNIRVLNLSLGHPVCDTYTNDPLCQAVEAAWQAGIVVVCAAGNEGRMNSVQAPGTDNEGWGTNYGSIQSPANDPYVITVGAMKQLDGIRADDGIATYSSRGPTLGDCDPQARPRRARQPGHLAGRQEQHPGHRLQRHQPDPAVTYMNNVKVAVGRVRRLLPAVGDLHGVPGGGRRGGAAAAANPSLSPDTVKARLMVSADKLVNAQGVGDACTYGAGYLDIPAALQTTVTVPAGTYALSPMLVADGQGNVCIAMDPSVYGSRALWGYSGIWGRAHHRPARPLGDQRRGWLRRPAGRQPRPLGQQHPERQPRPLGLPRPLGQHRTLGQPRPLGQVRPRRGPVRDRDYGGISQCVTAVRVLPQVTSRILWGKGPRLRA